MKKFVVSLCVVVFALSAFAQNPVAQLPQATVDTTWSLPSGATWPAHTAAQFSSALVSANPGDTIVLDAGVVYTGNFVVPAKGNNGQWIYIVSSNLSALPASGNRVAIADAVNMPKIVTPNTSQALAFASGSNHIRVVGVEIYSASTYQPSGYTPGVNYGYYIVGDAGAWPWAMPIPDNIILDRVYVHGDPTHDLQAGVQGNWTNGAMVDSYCSEIHMKGTDTTCFGAFYTTGPLLIHNNYLEAAGENIIFGGAGQNQNPGVPSDITITGNYLFKPLSWVPLSTGSSPQYVVKNSLEFKSAQRVLVDNNIIENKWSAAQIGGAVVLTVRTSQSGDMAVVKDITITNNTLTNVVRGFDVMEADYNCGTTTYPNCHNAGDTDRIVIANNLLTLYNTVAPEGGHTSLIGFTTGADLFGPVLNPPIKDVMIQHNTVISNPASPCWGSVYFGVPGGWKLPFPYPVTDNVWIQDNVLCKQPTGDWGQTGMNLAMYMGGSTPFAQRFAGNVMARQADKVQTWPASNVVAASIVYVDPVNDNYQLANPAWTNTTDGALAGYHPSKIGQLPLQPPMITQAQLAQIDSDQTVISADQTAVSTDNANIAASQAALTAAQSALATDSITLNHDTSTFNTYLTTLCQSTNGHVYQAEQVNGTWQCVFIH